MVLQRVLGHVRSLGLQVVLSAAIGAGIVLVIQLGAGGTPSLRVLASGMINGISIWACCAGLSHLVWQRMLALPRPIRIAATGALLLFGGACGWAVAFFLNRWLLQVHYGTSPRSIVISLALTSVIALAVGGAITTIEVLRLSLERSIEELKAKEYAERELETAAAIQRRLLPPDDLRVDGLRIAARHLPARYVAGDFYDVFRTVDGRIAVAVADVVGKGMGASLIMASVKAALPLVGAGLGVAETLGALNRRLAGELGPREFVALSLVHLDPSTGSGQLGNAGLPDPYLVAAGASPAPIPVPGPRLPLGVRPDVRYRTVDVRVPSGGGLLLLTDGAPEARQEDGEPLGYERFAELLAGAGDGASLDLDRLVTTLRGATTPEPDDDWTLVAVTRAP